MEAVSQGMRPEMELAETFMVLDVDSGNSLSIFDQFDDAMSFLGDLSLAIPHQDSNVALVAFDKTGFAWTRSFPKTCRSHSRGESA
jgi:hypothetical protein